MIHFPSPSLDSQSSKYDGAPWSVSIVPVLPKSYIPRLEDEQQLRNCLLDDDHPVCLLKSAEGVGGIGKSWLTLAVARDPAVQAQFPDGMLWISLGPDPDLLTLIGSAIAQLEADCPLPTTLPQASRQLRSLLKHRQLLMVLEDVWVAEDVQPFWVVQDNRSHLLVVSRDIQLPEAQEYILSGMSADQALQLVEQQLGQPLTGEARKAASRFAKAVGYLPLSLVLAAQQVWDGTVTWQRLLTEGTAPAAQDSGQDGEQAGTDPGRGAEQRGLGSTLIRWAFGGGKDRQHRTRQVCLNQSILSLSPELRLRFAALSIFPHDITLSPPMAATLWNVPEAEAQDLLQSLCDRNFLVPGYQTPRWSTYRLPSVMQDIAQWILQLPRTQPFAGLGLSMSMAHQNFLERYRPILNDGNWCQVPDDGYIHQYLTWHLEKAGWIGELHQLLQEETPSGKNAWFAAVDQVDFANYSLDVGRAWRLAEDMQTSDPLRSIALQLRYALIYSTITALKRGGEGDRNLDLDGLESPQVSPLPDLDLDDRVLLQPEQILLGEETVAFSADELRALSEALTAFQADLPDLGVALVTTLQAIPVESVQTQTLQAVLPALAQNAFDTAFKAIQKMPSAQVRIVSLLSLLPHDRELVRKVFLLTQDVADEAFQLQILAQIIPTLPSAFYGEAHHLASGLRNPLYRLQAMGLLATLPPAEANDPVSAAPLDAGSALLSLPTVDALIKEALTALADLPTSAAQSEAIQNIAPYVGESWLPELLKRTATLPTEADRTAALAAVVAHVPARLLPQALEIARDFEDIRNCVRVLLRLVTHIPDFTPTVLEAIRSLQDVAFRGEALTAVIPQVESVYLPEIQEILRETRTETVHIPALQALLQRRPTFGRDALAMIQEIPPVFARATALGELVAYLPAADRPVAITIAQDIQFPYARAKALAGLLPYCPDLAREALAAVHACHQDSPSDVLLELIPHLPAAQVAESLALIRDIADGEARVEGLALFLQRSLPGDEAYAVLSDLLHELALLPRVQFWRSLIKLRPFLSRVGESLGPVGDRCILLRQVLQAIRDVLRQWP
ncbi:NB-ARC domain-containing protein [Lyngbya confervoides]|uniref:NB-ARC domain-containing protein n=1 Tax=Lyngbya confervoides BDU141951 TaxID=1574623 RepID=A0ABD4T770_9CYAN|nr:NB-ARC domain-containing protein [Lyngbya confervoides]MCM1984326.1 NB-ARC domain-containing protein [Lyngbya confervoides BDU141951]